MDYYSGAPEPENYNFTSNGISNGSSKGNGNFFQEHSSLVLIGLGALIALLILIFVLTGKGKGTDYNTQDRDSSLSQFEVYGGTLDKEFSKNVIRYTINAEEANISFSCKATSAKAKIEGCDEKIQVTDANISYNIKVTAENGDITRYYLTIVKSANFQEE